MKYKITMATIALIAIFSNQAFAENGHGGEGKGINQKREFSIGSEQVQKKNNEAMNQMPNMMPNMMHSDSKNMMHKPEETKK
ncbi:hypothetical protein [Sulfurospirillum arsenophilum]|uniref:hypothetical protein n=1 Tax=Sulfurospirillum arsenophilum TaxID=56698 RepID=UPI0005A8D5EE|nr:hypothetical protein [Sulfurospirillum arsenophilum]